MRMITSVLAVVMSVTVAGVLHASQPRIVMVSQSGDALFDANDEKKAMDEAVRSYLQTNPPEQISASICSAIEKTFPPSLPESAREKALRHIRDNITPDILKRMISAGLKRNFTVDEISVLARYDESQLSDDLRTKNDFFKHEITSEIRLLLAATSG